MRKGFLIRYMRQCTNIFTIYEEVVVIHEFAPDPSEFLIYEENFLFFSVNALTDALGAKRFSQFKMWAYMSSSNCLTQTKLTSKKVFAITRQTAISETCLGRTIPTGSDF
jgi:hypothetical protein